MVPEPEKAQAASCLEFEQAITERAAFLLVPGRAMVRCVVEQILELFKFVFMCLRHLGQKLRRGTVTAVLQQVDSAQTAGLEEVTLHKI